MFLKKRLALSTYLIIISSVCSLLAIGIIFYMFNSFQHSIDVGKGTLQGLKASDYTTKIRISASSLHAYNKDYLNQIAEGKKAAPDDTELELSTLNEAILGFAGEGTQIQIIATESKHFVELSTSLKTKTEKFLTLSKDIKNKEEIKTSLNEIDKDITTIENLASTQKDILSRSFSEGFNLILTQETNVKRMIQVGSILAFIVIIISILVIRRTIATLIKSNISISVASEEVNESSTNASNSASRLSELVTEQSSAVHETASSLDQITAMVDLTMLAMDRLVLDSDDSTKSTEKGIESVKTVEESIAVIKTLNDEMKHEIEANNKKISAINEIIKNIGQKTQVINNIVFQTKLLSFNASVEAARAGEQGKGFAVVAEEVGNLATMSGTAAEEISQILSSALKEVNKITVDAEKTFESIMTKSEVSINETMNSTSECRDVIHLIASDFEKSRNKLIELKGSSMEQTSGIHNIKSAMLELQQATNEVANLSSNSAQLSNKMDQNYQNLKSALENLNEVIHGEKK